MSIYNEYDALLSLSKVLPIIKLCSIVWMETGAPVEVGETPK